MPEIHLRQPGFMYRGPFTKNKEKIEKFKEMTTASLVFKFLDKKSAGANKSDGVIKSKILSNQRPLDLAM